jgi:hypothetical protein
LTITLKVAGGLSPGRRRGLQRRVGEGRPHHPGQRIAGRRGARRPARAFGEAAVGLASPPHDAGEFRSCCDPEVAAEARPQPDVGLGFAGEAAADRSSAASCRREVAAAGAQREPLPPLFDAEQRAEAERLPVDADRRPLVGDPAAVDRRALPGAQPHFAVGLEAGGGGDPDQQHGDARVDDVAAVAAPVA